MRRDLQDQRGLSAARRLMPNPCTISLGIGQIATDKAAEQPTSQTGSSRD
jgi:hypothetical protein